MSRLSESLGLKRNNTRSQIEQGSPFRASNEANHANHDNNEVTVETLKTPPLQIEPAPIRKRALAALVDSTFVGVAWISLLLWLHAQFPQPLILSAEYLAAITFGYYVIQEGAFASTVGKYLLGLRIVGSDGDAASIRESLIRNLLRFVDWLPLLYLLGVLTIATSSKRQRLGDLAAGTVVTLAPEKDINPPPAPFLFH